jgi:hypothetical protein
MTMIEDGEDVMTMPRAKRRLAKAGKFPPGMSDEARLMAVVVAMAGNGITFQNTFELMNEVLVRHGGDFDAAIDSLLSGKVRFEEIRPN